MRYVWDRGKGVVMVVTITYGGRGMRNLLSSNLSYPRTSRVWLQLEHILIKCPTNQAAVYELVFWIRKHKLIAVNYILDQRIYIILLINE